GLPAPWFEALAPGADPAAAARRVRYPCVLKPRALAASRGVMRVDDPAGFVTAFRRLEALLERPDARTADRPDAPGMLVEGFLPGGEVALEGLMTDGKLRTLAVFDKPDPLAGPTREPGGSGVMMIPIPGSGTLVEVGGVEAARAVPGVDEVRITIAPGQPVEPLPEGARYLGFLFARAARPEEAEAALREAHR